MTRNALEFYADICLCTTHAAVVFWICLSLVRLAEYGHLTPGMMQENFLATVLICGFVHLAILVFLCFVAFAEGAIFLLKQIFCLCRRK